MSRTFAMKSPSGENLWIRSFLQSATYKIPVGSDSDSPREVELTITGTRRAK